MLVYGDHRRQADPRDLLAALRERLAIPPDGLPVERHAALAALFIDAAELAQALSDAAAEAAGGDGPSALEDAALALLMPLARALVASWRALGEGAPAPGLDGAALQAAVAGLEALDLPGRVEPRTGEGYSYYALYPEAYAEAAQRAGLAPGTTLVGLRSIGLGLAAVVAAACGALAPLSLRPAGHPFRRELRLSAAMRARLHQAARGEVAVVDEGPGLSGSSLGCVADALEAAGADPARLTVLPGHGGELGPQASAAHRARWSRVRRPVVDVDTLLLAPDARPGHRLAGWFADLAGGEGRLSDLSGGAWRGAAGLAEGDWPGVDSHKERRKLLLQAGGGPPVLLKFVGLGGFGERAVAAERRLAQAGFAPEPLALRHGFAGRPWLEAKPFQPDGVERAPFVERLGRYLAWRALHLPAPVEGAGPPALLRMARVNAAAALGEAALAVPALDGARWADLPPPRPVWTDGRLHRREWLRPVGGGAALKVDGVDHALGHDLVGPQDVAWDLAGAAVEWALDGAERGRLLHAVRAEAPVEPALVRALEPAYAALQYAAFASAADAHGGQPAEAARLRREARRYRAALARLLAPA